MLHHILGCLEQGENIGLELLKIGTKGCRARFAIGRKMITIFALILGIIHIERSGIASGYGFVGCIEGCRTRCIVQEVETKVVLHIGLAQKS